MQQPCCPAGLASFLGLLKARARQNGRYKIHAFPPICFGTMARFSNSPFRSEAEAAEFLDGMRWPHGVACPGCGNRDRPIYDMSQSRGVPSSRNPDGKIRHGLRKCSACRLEFRATYGTPFQGLKVPLDVLLAVIVLHDDPQEVDSVAALSRRLGIKRETVSRISSRCCERDAPTAPCRNR